MPTTVSVLIACYHAEPFLPAALAGLRDQIHSDWELVVVEDGSRDGTERLVRTFAAQVSQPVRYDNLGTNRGVAAARNRLLELAAGDVVAFLDADDLWRPAHLANLVDCLHRGHALAFSGLELWDGATSRSLGSGRPRAAWLQDPRRWLYARSFIQTSSCVALPRATVDRVGRFDETLRIGEDRDYWFRALVDGGSLGFTGADTCRYTKHAGSSMTRTLRVAEDAVRFAEKHAGAVGLPPLLRRRQLAAVRWSYARLLRRSQPQTARRLGWHAWRATPWRPDLLLWCAAASLVRTPVPRR
jgi:glycosyltransferase involved in cell wall biosynthesis